MNHILITFLEAPCAYLHLGAGFLIRGTVCIVMGLLMAPSLLADQPKDSLRNLRLEGVTAIHQQVTAYFTDTQTSHVFTLKIGEMEPGGYRLLRVEHFDNSGGSYAVLSRGNLLVKIATAQGAESTANEAVLPEPPNAEAGEDDSDERIAVRPWKEPAAP